VSLVRSLRNNFCVDADLASLFAGLQLLITSGFHDGYKNCRTLGDICLMLEDYTNVRREKLTQVLHALVKGVNGLKEYFFTFSLDHVSNVRFLEW